MSTPDTTRCTAKVHEPGRGIFVHQCQYKALPGTDKCGIHTRKERPEPAAATGEPKVTTRTKTTRYVTFEYEAGAGPRVPSYSGQLREIVRISASLVNDKDFGIDGIVTAPVLKSGGLGQPKHERFPSLRDLPEGLAAQLRKAVES